MKLILLGAPGTGKGTMAQRLKDDLNIPQISTGDIFRKNIKEETPLGLQIKDLLARGEFVPDDITIAIVKNRLAESDCANGYILDGFPRTTAQAEALDSFQNIDCVINLHGEPEAIIARLAGRRFCPACNGTFHTSRLPSETVCPVCGGNLIIREDDREETVRKRLEVYSTTTFPLIEYYEKKGKLRTIDGDRYVDDVYDDILAVLKK